MKVKLGLSDRFTVHSLLPQEGHILELKAMEPLKAMLLPDMEEQEKIGMIVNAQGQPQWQKDRELDPRTFEITETVFDILRRELMALEKKGKLRPGHIKAYSIFVENEFVKKGK